MRRTTLRRYGLMLLAVVVTTLGMTTPAAQAADTGSISGTITYNGQPVADAEVFVEGDSTGGGGITTTDEDGFYRVSGLAAESYRVSVNAPGHPEQFAPGRPSWEDAGLFAVGAGETVVNEVLLPFGVISGRVTKAGGAGVGDIYVSANTELGTRGWAVTDGDGNYSAPVLPGVYTVQFQYDFVVQYAYGTRESAEATVFTVAAGQTVTVNDTLLPTGSVAGTVLTAGGQPAEGVEVTLNAADDGNGYGSAYTDSAGQYRVNGLTPGSYLATFTLQPTYARMFHPHTLDQDAATPVTVAADATLDLDETLFATGSISGRLTAADKTTPVVSASVNAYRSASETVYGVTDDHGDYSLDPVFVGDYKVAFYDMENNAFSQWAKGKLTEETAQVFAVTAGKDTVVNDSLLPTGSVKVTVKDAGTATTVSAFWAGVAGVYGETTDGALLLTGVPIGTHAVQVGSPGYEGSDGVVSVTVSAGNETAVTVPLKRTASVVGKVVDSKTGTPVEGVCILVTRAGDNGLSTDGCGYETDADGAYRMPVSQGAGSYQLFAIPNEASGYGGQWVGTAGGTGDQRQAAVLKLTAGAWTSAPTIKLDKAGTITGTITSETGQPMMYARMGVSIGHPGSGESWGTAYADEDGVYTNTVLGPYSWPLVFKAEGHALQWSGVKSDRFAAQTVKVTSGGSTTYNYKLKVGQLVRGKVTMKNGSQLDGRVIGYSTVTGDIVGVDDLDAKAYEMRVLGPVTLNMTVDGAIGETELRLTYYRAITVKRNMVIDFCIVSSTKILTCGGDLHETAPIRETRPVGPEVPSRPTMPGDGPVPRRP